MDPVLDDRDRWQQALTVLADRDAPDAREAMRRARRRAWRLTTIILAGALSVGVVVAIFLIRSPARDADPSRGHAIAGITLNLLGAVMLAVLLVRQLRRGELTLQWRAPTLVLSHRQRRSLGRQVSGREPLDPAVLPLARDVAERRARTGQLPLLVGLLVQQAGQALTSDSTGYTVFFVCLLVLYAISGAATVVSARRAARFLQTHPAG